MLPSIFNLTSLTIHKNKKKNSLKLQKPIINCTQTSDYGNDGNYSQQNKTVNETTTTTAPAEKEKSEFEILLPKIIINNINRNEEIIVENNNSVTDETVKSINNNHSSDPDYLKSEYCDSDYIDLYPKTIPFNFNQKNLASSMSRNDNQKRTLACVKNITPNNQLFSEHEVGYTPQIKPHKVLKRKARSEKGESPLFHVLKEQLIGNDGKLAYNNLRLACRDESKNKDMVNKFKVTLRPRNKSTYLRGLSKSISKELDFKSGSDIEFYLSSQNNIPVSQSIANCNYNQILNMKFKKYLNYKHMMYLKFNNQNYNDFNSFNNLSKANFKAYKEENSKSNSPFLSEVPPKFSNNASKFNTRLVNDHTTYNHYSLKLPKLNDVESVANAPLNNILASTNNFQIQHDKINNLTKELQDQIDKIVIHYPSINLKRKNGKLVKLKGVLKSDLTKYEKSNNNQEDISNYCSIIINDQHKNVFETHIGKTELF